MARGGGGGRVRTPSKAKAGSTNGRRKSSSSSPSAESSSNFLSKLALLRSFVGSSHCESDLSQCLRKCGYDVERAAGALLTGEFKGSGGGGQQASSISLFSPSAKRRRDDAAPAPTPPKASARASTSARKKVRHDGTSSPPSSSSPHSVTPSPSSPRPSSTSSSASSKYSEQQERAGGRLLLCRRWTVAINTTRHGSTSHREVLILESSSSDGGGVKKQANGGCARGNTKKGGGAAKAAALKSAAAAKKGTSKSAPLVRFNGRNVRCTLPSDLCSVLAPLLVSSGAGGRGRPLVELRAETLMEDRRMPLGSEVPVELSVYLSDARSFLALVDDDAARDDNSINKSILGGRTKSKKGRRKGPGEAAWGLLIWAQYGDALPYVPTKRDNADDKGSDESDGANEDGSSEEDNPDDANVAPSTEAEEENGPEWAKDLFNADASGVKEAPPELPDPSGFKPDVVTLRPYQRQALYWMSNRENDAQNSDSVKKELEFLSELHASSSSAMGSSSSATPTDRSYPFPEGSDGVSCDRGPVAVSPEAGDGIPALSGDADPHVHPLWQKRYLATDSASPTGSGEGEEGGGKLRAPVAFYVNELLGTASASPPHPPRQCRGGILADAMGLGKTVMLLALILRGKEDAEEGGRERGDDGGAQSTNGDAAAGGLGARSEPMDVEAASEARPSKERKGRAASKKPTTAEGEDGGAICLSSDSDDDDAADEDYSEGSESPPSRAPTSGGRHRREESSAPSSAVSSPRRVGGSKHKHGTTLVVAPLSLLSQWEEEIATKTNLSCAVHYGANGNGGGGSVGKSGPRDWKGTDVVVTTYGTLQSEYLSSKRSSTNNSGKGKQSSQQSTTPLLSFAWHRIILDEAHGIKNPRTAVSRACCSLDGERRWCVTGTPIQNSLEDAYGLLKFLRHEPWCEGGFWKRAVTEVMNKSKKKGGSSEGGDGEKDSNSDDDDDGGLRVALGRVRRVLSPLILRRTKDTLTADGKPILTLPPVDERTVSVVLSEPERDFYGALLDRSQSVFDGFLRNGTASKSWFAIFSLLNRLRQACDHVSLTVKSRMDNDDDDNGGKAATEDDGVGGSGGSKKTAVNGEFLNGLLAMFREQRRTNFDGDPPAAHASSAGEETGDASPSQEHQERKPKASPYFSQVAHSLTQCVEDNDNADGTTATTVRDECPICLERPGLDDAVVTPSCAHVFCRDCLTGALNEAAAKKRRVEKGNSGQHVAVEYAYEDGECPVCQTWVEASKIITLSTGSAESGKGVSAGYLANKRLTNGIGRNGASAEYASGDPDSSTAARHALLAALRSGGTSAKIDAVLAELDEVWRMDPGSKVLIYSQFLGLLDLLQGPLRRRGVPYHRLDGTMSLKERVATLERFNAASATATAPRDGEEKVGEVNEEAPGESRVEADDREASSQSSQTTSPQAAPPTTPLKRGSVFLVSMKAGGVGINLVSASSVFIVDPWWNAAIEDQCVNRIHRIGQLADVVRVRKFVVEDSVEEKIVALQRRKKSMAGEILSDAADGGGSSGGMTGDSKPTLDDFKLIFDRS